MEEEVGQVISVSSWALAAGIDNKVLLRQMHFGWHCRDELLRSTRSLVLYIAKNYRGLGVAFEDLVQVSQVHLHFFVRIVLLLPFFFTSSLICNITYD